MRVFGLNCGRSASTTFTRAFEHATNYTAGHESRRGFRSVDERLAYPDWHIESDLTLSFLLGSLAQRFSDTETLYVHLVRDSEDVARSWAARVPDSEPWLLWARNELGLLIKRRYRISFGYAIAHQFIGNGRKLGPDGVLQACRSYVRMVNDSIEEFARHHPTVRLHVEDPDSGLGEIWMRAGVQGDFTAALGEYQTRHNAR